MPKIQLAKPYIPEVAINNVVSVLRSGNLVQGEYVKKFEAELAQYLDVKHVILVSSGTAALHLSLIVLDVKAGDEIIVPAFTFPATANVVELVGAKPVLVDITLDDFCINTNLIDQAITPKTKAILPVHEFGQAAKMDDILTIAKKYNLKVIEDAACALGTEFNDKKTGTFGNIGCFSFHPRKAITTGEGGALVTNDDVLAGKIKALRNHGIYTEHNKIDFLYAGFNYRMTDFQAALGLAQLEIFDQVLSDRKKIVKIYNQHFSENTELIVPKEIPQRNHTYQTYHMILNGEFNRDLMITRLKEKGIETNFGANALNLLAFYRQKYKYADKQFPNAELAFKKGIALPIGSHLSEEDVEVIIKNIEKELFKEQSLC